MQRCWRGFYSRKYVHSFFARKAYLLAVEAKSASLKKEMASSYEKQVRACTRARVLHAPPATVAVRV